MLPSLVLMAEFRVGIAGFNLVYPEAQFLNPENPAKFGSFRFSSVNLSWVSWVFKVHELGLVEWISWV